MYEKYYPVVVQAVMGKNFQVTIIETNMDEIEQDL